MATTNKTRSSVSNSRNIRERKSFARIPEGMDVPNLIGIQRQSFQWFLEKGAKEALEYYFPIHGGHVDSGDKSKATTNKTIPLTLELYNPRFLKPELTPEECKRRSTTYMTKLYCDARLTNNLTGEVIESVVKEGDDDSSDENSGQFLGEFMMMTEQGTFIVNGNERCVVSQLVKSPGVFFETKVDKTSDSFNYNAKIVPSHGSQLEFETDKRGILSVRIDRKRKQPATIFIRALGIAETDKDIIKLFGDSETVLKTLDKDPTTNQLEALLEIYKKTHPGEQISVESAKSYLENQYFNKRKYDLARVGRYMINKKLGFDEKDHTSQFITQEDIIETLRYLIALYNGEDGYQLDDIDHFGNRRIKTSGELIYNEFRTGLSEMTEKLPERLNPTEKDFETVSIQKLINFGAIKKNIKKFFGSSQLSQFMDQMNSAAGITHKRRLSALGPHGLTRERAGFEVRDVHTSHYGRMCPIETPEGQNIGLIGSLATYARVNDLGFIETPYRVVKDGKVTDEIHYLTADKEENYTIAQANDTFDPKTREFGSFNEKGKFVKSKRILCRTKDAMGNFGEPDEVAPKDVDYMDVSPRQMVSVATSLIPFLEHDDANRALMGSNMQRQAVPLMRPQAPFVGTGIERRIAVDSGEVLLAKNDGKVDYVDSSVIIIECKDGSVDEYSLPKYQRSNQSGCVNHKPIVRVGDKIKKGDILADGPSMEGGELALGQNLLVAYMPWEGYNYEDAIIVSERVVSEDLLTSIQIAQYEVSARQTKISKDIHEDITREIPNVSEDALSNLDEDGIVHVGAEVFPGDILVGKVTPKGEQERTAEENLLRAIFGEKAREVRDTSLRVPHGAGGRVIATLRFKRKGADKVEDPNVEYSTNLNPGVNELVRVFVAQKRKVQQGDKLSGRHGNKGVTSIVLPVEDMPFLADGTPVDIILNPLGVPSRMNVGQLMENHLGWAARWGWNEDPKSNDPVDGPLFVACPVFDGANEKDISDCIEAANKNLKNNMKKKYGKLLCDEFVPQLSREGKTWLYDGRTGERFREKITVGTSYILKLGHMVDDKIHARSIGPYSLITQQPLGGKAQFGGQRFGEMEVWALYAYGASNVLEEILTIKSDDTQGRVKAYEAIIRGENIPKSGLPESFRVMVNEMRALCLNVEPEVDNKAIDMENIDDIEEPKAVFKDLSKYSDKEDLFDDEHISVDADLASVIKENADLLSDNIPEKENIEKEPEVEKGEEH